MEFDALFQRLYPPLFRYVHRLTGDADTADDVAQEAFVRLLDRPLPEEEARPWLFTVATNLVRDGARKAERRQRLLAGRSIRAEPAPPADLAVERGERVEAVRAALARLAPRDRQLLLMREEGFSYREIAGAVGVAPGSVGTLVARALRRFAEVFDAREIADASRD